jgi:hypothetical protein
MVFFPKKMRVVVIFCLLALMASLTTATDEEAVCANAPGIWDNFFTNLDQLFWRPWLDHYRVVRYATSVHHHHHWDETAWLSRSCGELGLSRWSSVALIHEVAWLDRLPQWISAAGHANQDTVVAALDALRSCPQTTWADNKAVAISLNVTLQRQSRCAYATKALRCAFGNLYWVLSYGLVLLLALTMGASFLFWSTFLCCCWCWRSTDAEE